MREIVSRSLVFTAFSISIARFYSCCAGSSQVDVPNIPDIAKRFGTKGRYEEVNPYLLDDILAVNKTVLKPPPGCDAVHLTVIIRHGTRFPTKKNVIKMHDIYNLVMAEAKSNAGWLHEIKSKWQMWYKEEMDGRIVEKGRDDHRHLAVRLATAFPSLFSEENLRGNRIKFITSSKHRCVDSIVAFQESLRRLWDVRDVDFSHEVNDDLMRFFDHCRRFIDDVENNESALKEVDLFKSSAEMKLVQEKMADRLQVPQSHITPDMAEAAFFLCAYELAIKSENSAWCNLFDESDAQVLEYKNDLKQYWKRGYGYDINRKSSCTLFHDIFTRLNQAANEIRSGDVTEPVAVQVGHAETLLPLLSLMNLFMVETPLTAANFAEQHNRTFLTSRMVPYAANLAFVLYSCQEGPRLQLVLNERPLTFPGISHPVPLFRDVKEQYGELLSGCDFDKECESPLSNCSKCSEL
ncbi:multiple inositol polyphosphate phosphatase 1b [Brienomyrus brachyistius]|uniref:multiple inositol polyphosphate phosphatase 1b n=1 Tax=Brienomyrus brachyistius TaxID=42636 RepID=UPI0020B1EE2C|nr:multiple inositol polyphosphate phosphatase 1b [Brienomyrus brachyistius]